MNVNTYNLDKSFIKKSFNKAANTFDQSSVLYREIGERMLERLDFVTIKPECILDLGCGTGYFSEKLMVRYKDAEIISVDPAENMLIKARENTILSNPSKFICGDAGNIPLPDNSADLIFSNLALHWYTDITKAFSEIQRVLKPEGLMMFTIFGPDTLKELRQSWRKVDKFPHVHLFMDMHDVGDCLMRSRLSEPVMDVEYFTLTYKDVLSALMEIKSLGWQNATMGRLKGLMGKKQFQNFVENYSSMQNEQGLIPATFEVIYGHVWGSKIKKEDGIKETYVSVSEIGSYSSTS